MKKFRSNYKQYIRFINSLSRRVSIIYHNSYLSRNDYTQIGLIALWKACKRWQIEKGSFKTYVCASISHEMRNEAIKSTGPLHASFVDKVLASKIRQHINNGKTEEYIARTLNISYERLMELKQLSMSINEIRDDIQDMRQPVDLMEINDRLSEEEMDLLLTDETDKSRTEKCRMFKKIRDKLHV